MIRQEAVAIVKGYIGDVERAIGAQSIEMLAQIAQAQAPLLSQAGDVLAKDIDQLIAEQADGPLTRLIEGFWLYFKATAAINTVNDIIANAMAQQAAAQQNAQQNTNAFAALDQVAAETIGKK